MIERANYEKVQIFLACLLVLNDLGLSKLHPEFVLLDVWSM